MEKIKAYQVTIKQVSDGNVIIGLYDYMAKTTFDVQYSLSRNSFTDMASGKLLNIKGKVSSETAAKLCSFCLMKDGIPCIIEPKYEDICGTGDLIKVEETITDILQFKKKQITPLETGDILFIEVNQTNQHF